MDALHWVIQGAAVADARRLEESLIKKAAPRRWERGNCIADVVAAYAEALP